MNISFRPITAQDIDFLFQLYASTRSIEMLMVPWSEEQKEAFLRHQFDAQHAHYQNFFPDAEFRIVVVDGKDAGRLYVDTFSWAQLLPYCPIHKWGEEGQRRIAKMGVDWFVNNMGGCDVWSTADGIHWDCMTRNGFDNECNWGIRQILSTPYGVFIATSNVLAPDRAIKRNGKWEYVHNPRGGCEIWRGANPPGSEHA